MPFILGGGTILLQILCVVHAIRTGRNQLWITVLIFLPLVGCIAYFVAEILPELMTSRRAQAVRSGIRKATDPNRDFRAAKRDAEMVGSANAKRSLAEEYMRRSMYGEAIELYRSALTGMHKDDPVLLMGLARALLANKDGAGAQAALDELQAANPGFKSYEAHMVYAGSLELQNKNEEALKEYADLVRYFPGEEARCRYALLLQKTGDTQGAQTVFEEIQKSVTGAAKPYQRAQKEWGDIAKRHLAG